MENACRKVKYRTRTLGQENVLLIGTRFLSLPLYGIEKESTDRQQKIFSYWTN